MERRIDVRQALRVFQKVLELGRRKGAATTYKRLDALSDYDGYTIILKDEYVTLTIYFHNKFSLDYSSMQALYAFLGKLEQIDRQRLTPQDRK